MKKLMMIAVGLLLGLGVMAQGHEVIKQEFYANGNIKAKYVQIDTDWVEVVYFFESGVIKETGFFHKGKVAGKWITYNENSQLVAMGEFTNGKRSGSWSYFVDGELAHSKNYDTTDLVGK
jgi:antitoxin component YwqK of YwqJK toxin-antitoxin module